MRITIEMSFLHHQLRGNNGKVNVAKVTIYPTQPLQL